MITYYEILIFFFQPFLLFPFFMRGPNMAETWKQRKRKQRKRNRKKKKRIYKKTPEHGYIVRTDLAKLPQSYPNITMAVSMCSPPFASSSAERCCLRAHRLRCFHCPRRPRFAITWHGVGRLRNNTNNNKKQKKTRTT